MCQPYLLKMRFIIGTPLELRFRHIHEDRYISREPECSRLSMPISSHLGGFPVSEDAARGLAHPLTFVTALVRNAPACC